MVLVNTSVLHIQFDIAEIAKWWSAWVEVEYS
jgi:hypothetical protein